MLFKDQLTERGMLSMEEGFGENFKRIIYHV